MTTAFAWHSVLIDSPEGATETHTTVEVVMFARMRFLIFSHGTECLVFLLFFHLLTNQGQK
jgi:hypothetical protein